ncbi:MAG TPA: hypothetical protein P5181_03000 [Dermatophilaceae bacterium]|nr:hypothetical protein [Dermatophilaceae bacterium]
MTSVLTALAARWDGPVVAALEGSGRVVIARRCADLADLLATAASGLGSVALVSPDLRGLSLSEVADLRRAGVEVVGVSDPADEGSELRLWQLGLTSVVRADAAPDELVAVVLSAAAQARPGDTGVAGTTEGASFGDQPWAPAAGTADPWAPRGADPFGGSWSAHSGASADGSGAALAPGVNGSVGAPAAEGLAVREDRGRIIAVWGPSGAPGRTSVAVAVASELALLGREVLLVDADTYGGSVAQTLSVLDEAPGVAAACRAADQGALDLLALARLAGEVTPRLRVLTGIPTAQRWLELRGPALERVLEVGRALAEFVVVDVAAILEDDEELSYDTLAPRRNQATLTVLEVADELLAVGGCDPVSLQRLVRGLQELGTVRAPHPQVVVNRVRAGAVGAPPERHVAEALARFAGVHDLTCVPQDGAAFDAAMFTGRTLAETAPGSPARAALAGLAARLAGVPAGPVALAPRRRRLGRRS